MVTVNLRHHFKSDDFEPQKKLDIKKIDVMSSLQKLTFVFYAVSN